MDWNNVLKKWQGRLKLEDWDIKFEEIPKGAVEYPDDIGEHGYWYGIDKEPINIRTKKTVFTYDSPLNEEAIIHELLHLKFPEWSEDNVNKVQNKLMKTFNIKRSLPKV